MHVATSIAPVSNVRVEPSSVCFGSGLAGALAGALALDWCLVDRDRFAQAVPATPFARPHWRPPSQCPSSSERRSYLDLCLTTWSLTQSSGNGRKAQEQWIQVERSVEHRVPGNLSTQPLCHKDLHPTPSLYLCTSSSLNNRSNNMAVERRGSPQLYDDHPSLSASLEDFEHNERSPVFDLPSQHSGFKSENSESEEEEVSEGVWSPPAWRQHNPAGGWYRHQPYPQDNTMLKPSTSASRSRGTSPRYESAQEEDDLTVPANIPLPKGSLSPVKDRTPSHSPSPNEEEDPDEKFLEVEEPIVMPESHNNCVLPCKIVIVFY